MFTLEVVRPRLVLITALTAALLPWRTPHRDARVAIEVDCTNPTSCTFASTLALDVWSEEQGPALPLELVVRESDLAELAAAGVTYRIEDPDIDASAQREAARVAKPGKDFYADYRDYDAIVAHLRALAAADPAHLELSVIGGSAEGRPIWALKIGNGPTKILVNGTQHAREWISTMVVTSIADRLASAPDPASTYWIVPIMNPDGYQYTWGTDRYWRKNRRGGYGVDLNRNWSVAWGGSGASKSKRADTYCGEYPFSEPETHALRNLAMRERFALHVDFHAFSQLILYPWGWTGKPAADRDRFAAVGDKMASAMYAQHKAAYRLMQSVELYPAAGTMEDWMYGEGGALSYTIELRPKNGLRNGFVLPPEQIKPTSDEAFAALVALRGSMP